MVVGSLVYMVLGGYPSCICIMTPSGIKCAYVKFGRVKWPSAIIRDRPYSGALCTVCFNDLQGKECNFEYHETNRLYSEGCKQRVHLWWRDVVLMSQGTVVVTGLMMDYMWFVT